MNRRYPSSAYLTQRARRHFETVAIVKALDRAERLATALQFATAAKIAARVMCSARLAR